jgi:hypothetical protein
MENREKNELSMEIVSTREIIKNLIRCRLEMVIDRLASGDEYLEAVRGTGMYENTYLQILRNVVLKNCPSGSVPRDLWKNKNLMDEMTELAYRVLYLDNKRKRLWTCDAFDFDFARDMYRERKERKMTKGTTAKERFNELRYQMEKNSFVLSVLESRLVAVLNAESMGYDDLDTALITHISTEYVKFIRAVKDKHSGSIEEMAQKLYDHIYIDSGIYGKFRLYDEELIEKWFANREQERQLRAGDIALDDFIASAKRAYETKTGKEAIVIVKEKTKEVELEEEDYE